MTGIHLNQSEVNDRVATEEAASAPPTEAAARVVVPAGFTVMRLSASTAAGIAEGALPRILTQRAAVAAEFGEGRASYIDGLTSLVNETQDAYLGVTIADTASMRTDALVGCRPRAMSRISSSSPIMHRRF